MISSIITAVLSGVFVYATVYSIWFAEIDWKDIYSLTILYVAMVLGIITFVYSVFTIILAILGRRYYDIGKKAAKEAGDISLDRLNIKFTGYTMITYILLAVAVYALALYFKNDISEFDKLQAEDNTKFINLFNRVFMAGMVMSAIQLVMTVFVFVKGSKQVMYANKIVLLGQSAVTAFYVLVTVVSMNQTFCKMGYADSSYMIFSYLMIVINLFIAIRAFKMKITE